MRSILHCLRIGLERRGFEQMQTFEVFDDNVWSLQQDGSYTDKKRTGRPRVTTAREDNVMRKIVVRSTTNSMKKIKAELLRRGRRISHMTVSRRLSKEFNLKSYKPAKKPRLTAAMRAKRLQFANNHQHCTADQWRKVHFLDESTFQQFVVR